MAALPPSEVRYQQEHINDDRRPDLIATAIAMAVLSTAAVIGRLICRRYLKSPISWDDYTIVLAWVVFIAVCASGSLVTHAVVLAATHYGAGLHIIAVSFPNLQNFFKCLYVFELTYGVAIVLVKISIVLFYFRLFPKETTSRRWRWCAYGITALQLASWIAGFTTAVFQCRPVSYFWRRTGDGSCINLIAMFYVTSTIIIVTDVAVLLLPVHIVWKLQMPRSRKICIVVLVQWTSPVRPSSQGFLRLSWLTPPNPDVPLDNTIWSIIEPSIAIVSACLPILGSVFRTQVKTSAAASWFTRSKHSGQGSKGYGQDSHGRRHNSVQLGMRKNNPSATVYAGGDEDMEIPLTDIRREVRIDQSVDQVTP
ncbi:MAG: hypothetical protein Q9219_003964 [cf. Caloplaca sp. 3 TL-2023]